MTKLSPREISRYRRQLSLAGFGREAQEKLADAHVAVIGAAWPWLARIVVFGRRGCW